MKGYIVKDLHGNYLSRDKFWFPHDTISEAYVHEYSIISEDFSTWSEKPYVFINAEYKDGTVTRLWDCP